MLCSALVILLSLMMGTGAHFYFGPIMAHRALLHLTQAQGGKRVWRAGAMVHCQAQAGIRTPAGTQGKAAAMAENIAGQQMLERLNRRQAALSWQLTWTSPQIARPFPGWNRQDVMIRTPV